MVDEKSQPRVIVISACDEGYAFLARDLCNSIRALTFSASFDLALLDVGMNSGTRHSFEAAKISVVSVKSDIEYPAREHWEAKMPGVRALTAAPFLRRYFPGYDIYVWLDADVWVQTPEAIETLITSSAVSPGIQISCEFDRCYRAFFEDSKIWLTYADWYQKNFPPPVAHAMTLRPMLNAGVFAMAKQSPVWDAWAEIYTEALQKTTDLSDTSFMAHQLGLNVLLYTKGLPCTVMPASFNWLTTFALPALDPKTSLYVEPLPPHRVISQIHLTRPQKNAHEKIQRLDGVVLERPLTYSARG